MADKKENGAKEIWETLSKIDVSDHIEKKGGLSYLSWAWAWGVLKEHYPEAEYKFREWPAHPESRSSSTVDYMSYPDGTASVHCIVSIPSGPVHAIRDISASMWLPVMDYKNRAIPNPDARAVSDSKMRCLVKCIAMLGLGHYIYAGEDIPSQESTGGGKQSEPYIYPGEDVSGEKGSDDKEADTQEGETEEAGMKIAYKVFMKDCETIDELRDFWRKNQQELKKLEKNDPETYKQIFALFANKKKELS